jgi:hypothetical protein
MRKIPRSETTVSGREWVHSGGAGERGLGEESNLPKLFIS